MKLETAKVIHDAAIVLGETVTLYKDYSGRCMYGATTTGVVGKQSAIITSITQGILEIPSDEVDAYLDDISDLRWDNMGLDHIAY